MSISETLKNLERDEQVITAPPKVAVETGARGETKPLEECAACQGIAAIVIAILYIPAGITALLIASFLAGVVGEAGDPVGALVFIAALLAQAIGFAWLIWTVSEALF